MQTEVEAFLSRIRAFPDDDAPRLIFADWLEEQAATPPAPGRFGQPFFTQWGAERGRFIRIQIALARLIEQTEVDDDQLRRADHDEAQSELLQLLKDEHLLKEAHREEWTAPFHNLAYRTEFRRGFVEEIQVEARVLLRNAGELFDASPLRHIRLLEVADCHPAVFQCPYLNRLTALTIFASRIGEPLARTLARSGNLSELKSLYLPRNSFGDEGTLHLAGSQCFSKLEELDLSENELGETSAQSLAASPHLSALKRLDLKQNRLGPVGAELVAGSDRLAGLESLNLSANEIGNSRVQTLSRTRGFYRVPNLELSLNELQPQALHVILNRSDGPVDETTLRLRTLNLDDNPLGDEGMRVIAACSRLENLKVIRLANCRVGDEGVRILASSPYLNNLVRLELSRNPISDTGCRVLLDPPQLRKLKRAIVPTIGVSKQMRDALEKRYTLSRKRTEEDKPTAGESERASLQLPKVDLT